MKAIRQAAASVCSLSETEFDIRFNPDIFSPSVRHAEPCAEKLAQVAQRDADREAAERAKEAAAEGSTPPEATESNASTTTKEVAKPKKYPSMDLQTKINKEACEFLLMYQIPQFVRDITSNRYANFFSVISIKVVVVVARSQCCNCPIYLLLWVLG